MSRGLAVRVSTLKVRLCPPSTDSDPKGNGILRSVSYTYMPLKHRSWGGVSTYWQKPQAALVAAMLATLGCTLVARGRMGRSTEASEQVQMGT